MGRERTTTLPRNWFDPPFRNGDRLDQPTFHRLFSECPDKFKAELIGGLVYISGRVPLTHGRIHASLICWAGHYQMAVEEVEGLPNVTTLLGPYSEVQPDLTLPVRPEFGGRTADDADGYVVGGAELVAEVAFSEVSIDTHAKLLDYERYGVREYLVVIMREREVRWFVRRKDRFTPMDPDAAGVLKSKAFPGLWLDVDAMFDETATRLLATLRKGLASPEHTKFAAKLAKKLS